MANAKLIACFTIVVLALSLFAFSQGAVSSDDWSMFRRDAAHNAVSLEHGPLKPVVLWNFSEGSYNGYYAGGSSAAVVNGVVYVGSSDRGDGKDGGNIYALNAYTGEKIWNYSTSRFVHSSPAVSNNMVYVGCGDFRVYALNALTGAKVWSYKTDASVDSSPAVFNGVVYVGSMDGNVYALDAFSGAKLWNYSTDRPIEASPAVVDGVVYVGAALGSFYALDAATGTPIWIREGMGGASSPTVCDGVVYVGCWQYVYALNASTGSTVWCFKAFIYLRGAVTASPVVSEGIVYVGSQGGGLYAINASNGSQVWRFSDYPVIYSSACFAEGVVYVSTSAFNASNGEVFWHYNTRSVTDASPTLYNGVIYIGSGDAFCAIGEPIEPPSLTSTSINNGLLWIVLFILTLLAAIVGGVLWHRKRANATKKDEGPELR